MSIAERLVFERKRLGLSQAAFARDAGVSLSSQKRYEKGDRDPDTAYLSALGAMAVDVGYILSGVRATTEAECQKLAAQSILYRLCRGLGISLEAILELESEAENVWLKSKTDGVGELAQWPDYLDASVGRVLANAVENLTDKVGKARNQDAVSDLDSDLMVAIFDGVEKWLFANGRAIPADKKYRVVAMLYRAFRVTGKVDQAIIDEAVKLAAG